MPKMFVMLAEPTSRPSPRGTLVLVNPHPLSQRAISKSPLLRWAADAGLACSMFGPRRDTGKRSVEVDLAWVTEAYDTAVQYDPDRIIVTASVEATRGLPLWWPMIVARGRPLGVILIQNLLSAHELVVDAPTFFLHNETGPTDHEHSVFAPCRRIAEVHGVAARSWIGQLFETPHRLSKPAIEALDSWIDELLPS